MSVSSVDWDVAKLTKNLIDEKWKKENTSKPQYIDLRTEDSDGSTRKRIRRHNEYILVAEESERGMEYSDIFWNSRNLTAACYVELSTAESRERREQMLEEVERIAVNARTRNESIGTPGGWDNLQIQATVIDDENFGWWVAEVTFNYAKRKDAV